MTTADDDFITVGEPFPQIEAVAPLAGLVVLVTWATGKQVAVDLGPTLHRFKLYAPLRADRALFETVHVANASTIAWGADDAIDMHVGELERLAGETMDAADFKAWMKDLGLTLDSAAAMLGMSRRTVAYYSSGQEIPRYVVLACAGLAALRGVEYLIPEASRAGMERALLRPMRESQAVRSIGTLAGGLAAGEGG